MHRSTPLGPKTLKTLSPVTRVPRLARVATPLEPWRFAAETSLQTRVMSPRGWIRRPSHVSGPKSSRCRRRAGGLPLWVRRSPGGFRSCGLRADLDVAAPDRQLRGRAGQLVVGAAGGPD